MKVVPVDLVAELQDQMKISSALLRYEGSDGSTSTRPVAAQNERHYGLMDVLATVVCHSCAFPGGSTTRGIGDERFKIPNNVSACCSGRDEDERPTANPPLDVDFQEARIPLYMGGKQHRRLSNNFKS
ncbi:hypothetical protein OUZ56_022870 [Daphnia magna]|uniref:Uncharacterized protein n=1 Tax=Daphnia magna TaxID=35525 RepID=A0ABR0AXU3_9CRUS|nr:hypothetical protein OUZ56_022870 [Daphnia magna]